MHPIGRSSLSNHLDLAKKRVVYLATHHLKCNGGIDVQKPQRMFLRNSSQYYYIHTWSLSVNGIGGLWWRWIVTCGYPHYFQNSTDPTTSPIHNIIISCGCEVTLLWLNGIIITHTHMLDQEKVFV